MALESDEIYVPSQFLLMSWGIGRFLGMGFGHWVWRLGVLLWRGVGVQNGQTLLPPSLVSLHPCAICYWLSDHDSCLSCAYFSFSCLLVLICVPFSCNVIHSLQLPIIFHLSHPNLIVLVLFDPLRRWPAAIPPCACLWLMPWRLLLAKWPRSPIDAPSPPLTAGRRCFNNELPMTVLEILFCWAIFIGNVIASFPRLFWFTVELYGYKHRVGCPGWLKGRIGWGLTDFHAFFYILRHLVSECYILSHHNKNVSHFSAFSKWFRWDIDRIFS